jgi:hypothetical protein
LGSWIQGHGRTDLERRHRMTSGDASRSDGATGSCVWVPMEIALKLLFSAGERPQAAHLLKSWFRISPGAWIFVCCDCRVLSGRGLCDELITRPEESYRMYCVIVCDLETSRICTPYIYDIRSLRVNDLSLILLMCRKS